MRVVRWLARWWRWNRPAVGLRWTWNWWWLKCTDCNRRHILSDHDDCIPF